MFFFTKSLILVAQNVFHLYLSQKAQSNFENQITDTFIENMLGFAVAYSLPGQAHVLLVYPQRNVVA